MLTRSLPAPITAAAVQPKRIPAPHVQAAVAAVTQRPAAPHVQAAVAQAKTVPERRGAVPVQAIKAAQPRMPSPPAIRPVPVPPAVPRPVSAPALQARPSQPQPVSRHSSHPQPPVLRLTSQGIVLQPYTVHGDYKVSTSTHYAISTVNRWKLYVRVGAGAAMPAIYTWTWQATGAQVTVNGINYQPYKAIQNNGTGAALPSDCIKSAQIVAGGVRRAAGANLANLDGLPEPNYRAGGRTSGALGAQPGVGDVYLVVHSTKSGDFHAASVILHDGTDNITLEADVDDPLTFRQNNLLFDMYNEATGGQSFWDNQGASASDRVWSFSLANAAGGAGHGTLGGDIRANLDARQLTRLGQVMT